MNSFGTFKAIDNRYTENGYRVRYTNQIDADVVSFESEILKKNRIRPYDNESRPIQISLTQRTDWLQSCGEEFRLLQISLENGEPAAQIAAVIHHVGKFKTFSHAVVSSFDCACINIDLEYFALKIFPSLLKKDFGIFKMIVRGCRQESQDLFDFESIARRAGYTLQEPLGVTRTILYRVDPNLDDLLSAMDKKTRAKVKHHSREKIEIRRLYDEEWIPQMKEALEASFLRTGNSIAYFDFYQLMRMAKILPKKVLVLGFFLKDEANRLLAYSASYAHGDTVEAVSSGSINDTKLRSMPFNYFMFWELVLWAQSSGAKLIDMGGVTDGGSTDPMAGISKFKRHFSKTEAQVACEMEIITRYMQNKFFNLLK